MVNQFNIILYNVKMPCICLTICSFLSALMEEKLKNPPVKTGLITMSGDIKVSSEEDDVFLSEPLSAFKSGEITMILGHPESWMTSTAEEITESLKNQDLVIGTFLDEFQMNSENHWGSDFRYEKKYY